MPNKILALSCGTATLALGLVLSATSAYAGFQWVAPNSSAAYQLPAYQAPAPRAYSSAPLSATNAPEVISPVIISGDVKQAQTPLPPLSPITLSSKEGSKVDLATATISAAPSSTEASPSAPSGADVVQGFALQVPLALALRQVLPIGYSFSIDQGIDMDTLVSYKGGKAWRETLNTMLAPEGLASHEQGTVVTISRNGASVVDKAPLLSRQPVGTLGNFRAPLETAPPVNVSSADGWSAERGDTLRKVLTDWCRRSGVELKWQAEYDYPIEASAHFNNGFEDAVRNLLAGFDGARPQPIGELHSNSSAGQRVLVVQARGNSYSN